MTARHSIGRTMRDERGVAFLEFALALPLLMLLFLGGVEVSRYVQAGQKADKVTHTVVDLIAQAPTISEPELDQIMQAVSHIMTPYRFDNDGVIIVSCVGYDSRGRLRVKWQYKGAGTLNRDSAIGQPGGAPDLPEGFTVESRDNVIIAETYYAMQPMVNTQYIDPIEIYRTAFYLPRIGELDTLRAN